MLKKEYDRRYYILHKDKKKLQYKKYVTEHRDSINAYHKLWYSQNRERVLAQYKNLPKKDRKIYFAQYRKNNKNKIVQYGKKYYETNKDRISRYYKKRNDNRMKLDEVRINYNQRQKERRHKLGINKKYIHEMGVSYTREYRRMCENNRRSLEVKAGPITIKIIQQIYEQNIKHYGTLTCYLCLKAIDFGYDSIEHKIPLSRGGTNCIDNLGIAHKKCNSKKNNKTETEYRMLTERLGI